MRLLLALVLIGQAVLPVCGDTTESPAEVVEETSDTEAVPLKQIWAHDMPGTREISELEEKPEGDDSLMATIGRALRARHDRKVGKSFAVEGKGLDALKEAFSVITGQHPEDSSVPTGEVSIVFFTHYSPYYVHLADVTRKGEAVRIEYQLVPHLSKELTSHFALIPLGDLPKGDYKVDIIARPIAEKFITAGFKEVSEEKRALIVSESFKFRVN